jgi:hypothetical protein
MNLRATHRKYSSKLAVPVMALAFSLLLFSAVASRAQDQKPPTKPGDEPAKPPAAKLGLIVNEPTASPGYTLLASSNATVTYLVDMQGRVVNSWKSDCLPGLSAYLLDDGHLLRTGQVPNPPFFGGGTGGRIQEFAWDGKLVWDFSYVNDTVLPNHDICKLPNGNVLMIVWEKKSGKDAVAAGRRPETVSNDYLLSGALLEIQPTGKTTGKIVWEWHAWDHLIQDFDDKKSHHGDVAAHPELIDLDFGDGTIAAMVAKPEELEKLRSIGYVGGAGRRPGPAQTDWLHINGVAYNPALDQIMLSVYEFSELWVIDHGTTTAEAAGHAGGKAGKGGDLLYRWGNPRAYRAGSVKDQKLFGQHNAHWIDKGLPGEGHVLIFNNGVKRTGGAYSSVDEIVLPLTAEGRYEYAAGKPLGPDRPTWSYSAPKRIDFYAPFISGAQRLANADTLICSGTNGTVFEVTGKGEIVWKYVNPTKAEMPGIPGGTFTVPLPGQILSTADQDRLKLTAEQKKKLAEIQKETDDRFAALLKDEQKTQFKQIQDFAKAFANPPPGGFPGFGGPAGGTGVFRAPRYAPDFLGLKDKDLKPRKTIEEIQETAKEE